MFSSSGEQLLFEAGLIWRIFFDKCRVGPGESRSEKYQLPFWFGF